MSSVSRRRLFKLSATLAGGLALSGTALASPLVAEAAGNGYGPLKAKRPYNEPNGPFYLALPDGFEYIVFSKAGEPLSDGSPTPGGHDGMGAFRLANGNLRLIRNHERGSGTPMGDPARAYDSKAAGGTTSLEFNPKQGKLVKSFVSLGGTVRNCAGGTTPINSWLTCEETTVSAGTTYAQNHGYIFNVPAAAEQQIVAQPLKQLGRTACEAAVIDPQTGIVYLTEDTGDAGFYRFVPDRSTIGGDIDKVSGRLQMLRVKAGNGYQYDTRTGQTVGQRLDCDWVTIGDPSGGLWSQGWALGGARFARLEGAWFARGRIFFDSTSGGNSREGQIWEYNPRTSGLTLLYESPAEAELDNPDNLTVSPRGGLVICEDGSRQNLYVRGLYRDGANWKIFPFIQNVINDSEFAGACYSPDGSILFVNIQSPGYTFAIAGPWQRGAL